MSSWVSFGSSTPSLQPYLLFLQAYWCIDQIVWERVGTLSWCHVAQNVLWETISMFNWQLSNTFMLYILYALMAFHVYHCFLMLSLWCIVKGFLEVHKTTIYCFPMMSIFFHNNSYCPQMISNWMFWSKACFTKYSLRIMFNQWASLLSHDNSI